MKLVEFFPAASPLPADGIGLLACTVALIVYAVIQAGKSSDDDGPGDGGLMQPVSSAA